MSALYFDSKKRNRLFVSLFFSFYYSVVFRVAWGELLVFNMADCSRGSIPPENAKFFNSLPHVNFDFDNISKTFRPTDEDYQQNLILYSAIPAVIGVIFFIILGIYFTVYCCKWCCKRCRKQLPRRKAKTKYTLCLTVCIWLFALLSIGSIISGFVFNDGINNGVITVTMAVDNVSNTFDGIHNQVSSIQNNILDMKENIDSMLHGVPLVIAKNLWMIRSNILQIIEELNGVKPVNPVTGVSDDIKTGEFYRWWSVFGVLGLTVITCLITVYSSIRHSRCGFFLALLLGCIAWLGGWLVIGAHFGASIGMSDLCVSPRKTINFYMKSVVTKDVVNYYLDCKPGSIHPFEKYVDSSLEFIQTADVFLQKLKNQSWAHKHQGINKLTINLHNIDTSLDKIQENMKCTKMKKEYNKAHCAVCFPVVDGLTLLLVASLVSVVFLVIILLLITLMCRRINKKSKPSTFMNSLLNGAQSEETEYHSVTSDDESMPLVPSNSPPPYEAVTGCVDFQFHSCQEERNRATPAPQPTTHPTAPPTNSQPTSQAQQDVVNSNQQNHFAPPPLRGEVVVQRKVTMAF